MSEHEDSPEMEQRSVDGSSVNGNGHDDDADEVEEEHDVDDKKQPQSDVDEKVVTSKNGGAAGGGEEEKKSRKSSRKRSRSGSVEDSSKQRSGKKRRASRSTSRDRRHSRSRSETPPSRGYHRSGSPAVYKSRYAGAGGGRYNDGRDNPEPCRCLGIFGMSLNTNERDLKKIFGAFGSIETVQIVYDRMSGRSRGFGFVYFDHLEDSIKAKERLAGQEMDGHKVRIDYSVTKFPHAPTPGYYMGLPQDSGGGRGGDRRGGNGGGYRSSRAGGSGYDRGYSNDRGGGRYDRGSGSGGRDRYNDRGNYRERSPPRYGGYDDRRRGRSRSPYERYN